MDLAVRNGTPIVGLIDSGGTRIQIQQSLPHSQR